MTDATCDQLSDLANNYKSRATPGNCYQDGFQCLTGWSDYPGLVLVHGVCKGQGGLIKGIFYGHAWVEVTLLGCDFCVDLTGAWPKDFYYRFGQVKDVVRYDERQAYELALKYGHYGSWKRSHVAVNKAVEKLCEA